MENIQLFIGTDSLTVSEAMKKIDSNAYGILFIVNSNNKLLGCITDGDIRRFLLSGGNMTAKAVNAANANPKIATNIEEARKLYHKRNFIAVPIVNDNHEIVDIFVGEDVANTSKRGNLNLPVVINAGGKGTRLDPFTRVLPKPLIPVGEYPIIELIMREYQTYSCEDFHIIVNYKKDLLKAYFADNDNQYHISWYDESEPLGTGGGLSLLKGKINETFFFANCDVLLTANYEKMLAFHREHGNAITMICAHKNFEIPYGVIDMGLNGRIESMREKPTMSFLTNTGCYIVEPEVLEDMVDGESIGFPDVIERQKAKGRKVAAYPILDTDWMDMGQLPELEKMRIKLYGE